MTAHEKTDKFLRSLGYIPDPLRGGEYRKFNSLISFTLRGWENCELMLKCGGAVRAAWFILPCTTGWGPVKKSIKAVQASLARQRRLIARQRRLILKTTRDKDYHARTKVEAALSPGVSGQA